MNNDKKIKLIWDFRGPDAAITAQHHEHHLKEFQQKKQLSLNLLGSEKLDDEHHIAYLVVTNAEMPAVRDALRPHRGQVYTGKE